MAYDQFTLQRVIADFGLTVNSVPGLFGAVPAWPASAVLRDTLAAAVPLATMVNTEAARANFLIAPILAEAWRIGDCRFALYSGTRFDVDEAAGLVGVCDFILAKPPQMNYVTGPVLMIAEAKNEDMWAGAGQCAAAMVAAQRFNDTAADPPSDTFGAVSDGVQWKFLRLRGTALDIDMTDYLVADPGRILGILLHTLGVGA